MIVLRRRGYHNAHIPASERRRLCALDEAGERTLELAVRRLGLSARAHDRILKVARTVADLDRVESVSASIWPKLYRPQLGPELLDLTATCPWDLERTLPYPFR